MVTLIGQQGAPLYQQSWLFAQQARHQLVQITVIEQRSRRCAASDIQVHLCLPPSLQQQRDVLIDPHEVGLSIGLHGLT